MRILVDCGFSDGTFSRVILEADKKAGGDLSDWIVYGFEPNEEKFSAAWEKFKADYPTTKVHIQPAAVWCSECVQQYNMCDNSQANFLSPIKITHPAANLTGSKIVQCVDLVAFLNTALPDASISSVVKLDIEGAEFYILPKLQASPVAERLKVVFVEYHERFNPKDFNPIKKQIMDWWAAHPNIKHVLWY